MEKVDFFDRDAVGTTSYGNDATKHVMLHGLKPYPGVDYAWRASNTDANVEDPAEEFDDILKGVHTDASGDREILLPRSNVLCYTLEKGAKVIVRPSGTEPKIKFYITTKEPTAEASEELGRVLEQAARERAGI